MDPRFLRHKTRTERAGPYLTTSGLLPYNERFTLTELTSVINDLRYVAEGPEEYIIVCFNISLS